MDFQVGLLFVGLSRIFKYSVNNSIKYHEDVFRRKNKHVREKWDFLLSSVNTLASFSAFFVYMFNVSAVCLWLWGRPISRAVVVQSLSFTISPGVCSNSCPLRQWCYLNISSSIAPFSSCPQSFPASGSFPISQLFASGGQRIGASASVSVLSMNTKSWFPLGLTGLISLNPNLNTVWPVS